MPVGQAQMPLFDHLGELRRRVTVVVVALLVATCALYALISSELILFLLQPVAKFLVDGETIMSLEDIKHSIVILNPFDGFSLRFKVSFYFSILITSPVWLWQFLAFFLPALEPNERKWVVPTFFSAVALFAAGMIFCYIAMLDPAFEWLTSQTTRFANLMADAQSYVHTVLLFEIAFGVAFELPLVVFYLTVFNIIPYKTLRESWRTVYITLMVICAMVTPDGSPITMLLMFSAMLALYEGSLLVSRLVISRRLKQEKRAELA